MQTYYVATRNNYAFVEAEDEQQALQLGLEELANIRREFYRQQGPTEIHTIRLATNEDVALMRRDTLEVAITGDGQMVLLDDGGNSYEAASVSGWREAKRVIREWAALHTLNIAEAYQTTARFFMPPGAPSDDLQITKMTRRASAGGMWVSGRINGHRFDALVFPEHAENREWELGDSRISKLVVQRLTDRRTVFNWDRGPDIEAADATVQAIVDFLAAGLAEHVYSR